jgi:hypothetical protein
MHFALLKFDLPKTTVLVCEGLDMKLWNSVKMMMINKREIK